MDVAIVAVEMDMVALVDEVGGEQQFAIPEDVGRTAVGGDGVGFVEDDDPLGSSLTVSRWWVAVMMVLPAAASWARASSIHRWVRGSRPLVGSSRMRTSGLTARTAAMATFFFRRR
jgi:hypothetical protein